MHEQPFLLAAVESFCLSIRMGQVLNNFHSRLVVMQFVRGQRTRPQHTNRGNLRGSPSTHGPSVYQQHFICNFLVILFLGSSATARDQDSIRELLAKAESAISENYRDAAAVVDKHNSSLAKIEAFARLQEILNVSWKASLFRLNEITTNETQIALYFKAAQILPPEEYLAFVAAASDHATNKTISRHQFKWALFPSVKHLREIWAEDPPGASLQLLARKAKIILGEDAGLSAFFDNILSGKAAFDNKSPESRISAGDDSILPRSSSKPESPLSPIEPKAQSIDMQLSFAQWQWIIGGVLAVIGGILFKVLRK